MSCELRAKPAKPHQGSLAAHHSLLKASLQTRRENFMSLTPCSSRVRRSHVSRPSRCFHFVGTHKNLQPCRLPNLFSCQTSSSSACADSPASAGLGFHQPLITSHWFPTQCSAPNDNLLDRIEYR